MTIRIVAIACGLALSAGCSAEPQNNAGNAPNAGAGNAMPSAAAPAAPTGEAGFRQMAECAATFESLGALWEVISGRETGSERAELEQRAVNSRTSGFSLELEATSAGRALGRTTADVDRIKRERHVQLRQERERQTDFVEFATWLGREGDRCAAMYPNAR